MSEDAKRRGGKREGAGRRPVAAETVRLTVTLSAAQAAKARDTGNGNLAAGVRALIDGNGVRDAESQRGH